MTLPLEVHSCYSMLAGTAWPRQLVARAVEYGLRTLALTDTDGLYGALPFYTAARDAGIKPILGARLGPCLVLARDRTGYAHLCETITAVRLGRVDAARLDTWPFDFGAEHLFLISDDAALLRGLAAKGLAPLAAIVHYGGAASRRRAEALLHTAKQLGIKPVAVHPVYFLDRDDYHRHRVLAAIRENTTVSALAPGDTAPPEAWFCPPEQMERAYGAWPETLETLAWVAEECNLELSLGKPLFPEFLLPEGETAFSMLWKQTFEGLRSRYQPLTPSVLDRAHHELGVIYELGFAPYFLIVADIVRFAKSRDIPAVGRGSAANSLVAYALGITRVDPFRYNLYFERFLNRSRRDCPDIDLDLCWRGRDEVLDYVYERYGAGQVAMISTINTFQARAAVRETAKALGFTEQEIGPVTRVLPHYGCGDLRQALRALPVNSRLDPDAEPLKSVLDISQAIAGFPRHLATHACGTVIAPEPLTRYVPLERAAKGIVVTQFDKDPIEQLGLVKMDLLGHRALSAIHDTVAAVRASRDPEFDIEAIPDPDPATAALLRAGDTIGCFQVESPAMRGLLRKLRAGTCNALIQGVALVRPGASGSGMKQHFIDRLHGREPVTYPHPSMEQALGDTCGVMIYQEDVLKVAHAVAGMTLDEADNLRRVMSKKRGAREMARSMKRFLEGAAAQGVPDAAALEIWELVANFASYAYCKAHAATYGELAYQCAFLKVHYPVEYFTAVLANGGGFYAPQVYINEAQRRGVPVLPPEVNRSALSYTQEGDAVRVGFAQIAGLTEKTARALVEARKEGAFQSVEDLLQRVHIGITDGEALCQAGALDHLPAVPGASPLTRPMQLWRFREAPGRDDARLFVAEAVPVEMPVFPDIAPRLRATLELERLGQPLSSPLLRYHASACCEKTFIASRDLRSYEGRQVTLIGTIIAERRLPLRTGRGIMEFLTVEDAWGVFEAVLFPEAYQQFGHLSEPGKVRLFLGAVQSEQGDIALVIERVAPVA